MNRSPLGRRLALSALLFLGTLAAFGWSFRSYFIGAQSYEFSIYAEIASNILRGRGFSTATYWPYELAYIEKTGAEVGETGPVVGRFPLAAYWSAFWMKLAGVDDAGMALSGGAAHAFWAVAVYWAGCELFSEAAGGAAAVLWALNPSVLAGFDLFGFPDLLFGALFFVLNALWLPRLLKEGPAPLRTFFGLGVLAGLAYLARTSFGIWLPFYVIAALAVGPGRGRRRAGAFLLGFFVAALPYTVYYLRHLGATAPPILLSNLASGTAAPDPAWMEYRSFALGDFRSPQVLALVFEKAWTFLNAFLRDFPSYWKQPAVFPFAVLGAAAAAGEGSALAAWLGALLGWQVLVFSFLRYEDLGLMSGRYYLWAGPFLLLYAADYLWRRRGSRAARAAAALGLGLLLQGWARGYRLVPRTSDYPGGLELASWPEFAYIREHVPSQAWVASNIPAQITWYAGRRTVNVPNRPEDLARLEARWPLGYLYLSHSRIAELHNFPAWNAVLRSSDPNAELAKLGFVPEKEFPGGALFKKSGARP